jgi:hypothetical protein
MASELFNSISGYSTGIPPKQVIDSTGNVVTNVNAPTSNVTANTVYANTYRYANGVLFSSNAGGNNTQLQFNNNGAFGGIPNVTWNGNILSLGNVNTVSITGGENGYFLQTDGSGGLTWSPAQGGNGGNGNPGGANSQVQFNDAGVFGGDSGFTYNKVTNILTVDTVSTANANITNVSAENVTANFFIGDGSQLTGILPNNANFVIQPTQSNITQVGTLTQLTVSGNAGFQSNVNLGSVSNIQISGGIPGYVLTTDGTGNVSWQIPGAGAGAPGGSNTSIQFNNNGNFSGTTAFTFNNVSNAVNLTGNLAIQNLTANNATNYGNIIATGNITANGLFFGDGSYLTNVQANVANTVAVSAQPNITSVGTLVNLSVTGNIATSQTVSASGFQTSGNANVGILRVSNTATITGNLTANGNVNFSNSANINLGSVANIRISGGLNGYVLSTDGLGILSWVPQGGGGNTSSPGGANTNIQYNKNNEFAGNAFFTYNDTTNTVQIGGLMIANTFQVGSGAYKFGTSSVYFAVTASPIKQVLYSIPVSEVSGVDFEIIGTDSVGQKRQAVKISSVYYAGIVQYNEYAGLYVNGGVGTFIVEYNPGDVINPPSLDLSVTPDTSNNTVYKMLITILAP